MNMLLTEPGSRIEGGTEDVLRAIFEATWYVLREQMTDDEADQLALRHLVRVHNQLTNHGYVVRDYPG